MKDFHLRFALETIATLKLGPEGYKGWFDNDDYALFDLITGEVSDLPDQPGAYVLGTADGTMLVYPWGLSPVYYIGESNNLAARLSEHRNYTQKAIDDHDQSYKKPEEWWWLDRYTYGAAFGAQAVWYLAGEEVEPKEIERRLFFCFRRAYGAVPVANKKG